MPASHVPQHAMIISPLNDDKQQSVLTYLRRAPYRNALPLSNVSQLRSRCDIVLAESFGHVVGMASTYLDLPLPNVTFAADQPELIKLLLGALAMRNPHLHAAPIYTLLPRNSHAWLAQYVQVLESEIEYQMVVEPETLQVPTTHAAQRLVESDLPAMNALAAAAGLTVWDAHMLALGPAFGCFDNAGQLVAMAATHFVTPDVIEIGHIATHPSARRQGYALACTAALTQAAFALAPRVFLMVLDRNTAGRATYKRLGFQVLEPFHLTKFMLDA